MEHELVGVLVILLLPVCALVILFFPLLALIFPLSITAVVIIEVTRVASVAVALSLLVTLVPMLVIGTMVLVLFPTRGRFPVPGRFIESGFLHERSSFPVLDKSTVPTRVRHKALLTIISPPSGPFLHKTTPVFRRWPSVIFYPVVSHGPSSRVVASIAIGGVALLNVLFGGLPIPGRWSIRIDCAPALTIPI